jgi:signal peptidase II
VVDPAGAPPSAAPTRADSAPGVSDSASRPAPAWLLWGLATAVLVADFWTKRWVLDALAPVGTLPVIGDLVRFSYVRNSGVAFGLFADRGMPFGWVSLVALGIVLWLAFRPSARRWPRPVALGLILGGATGNMIDRVRWGSVVDFIDVGFGTFRWWVFNVADSAITVGVVLWAVHALFARPVPSPPASAPAPQVAAPGPVPIAEARARDDARGA